MQEFSHKQSSIVICQWLLHIYTSGYLIHVGGYKVLEIICGFCMVYSWWPFIPVIYCIDLVMKLVNLPMLHCLVGLGVETVMLSSKLSVIAIFPWSPFVEEDEPCFFHFVFQ